VDAVVVTGEVVTVNAAVVAPAATVTDDGTDAFELLDVRLTTFPPLAAAPLRVTVPVADVPPTTAVGDTVTLVRAAGLTVNVAVFDVPFSVAVIVGLLVAATASVVMVKVAVLDPPATATEPGTDAFALLDVRDTVDPPEGAGPLRVTVPVALVPPMTDVGVTARV